MYRYRCTDTDIPRLCPLQHEPTTTTRREKKEGNRKGERKWGEEAKDGQVKDG
jgi:hypothetical protein